MTEDHDVVRGARFSGGPARSFLSSLANDERIFDADIAVDRAHVVMLAEQSVIDASVAGDILGALAAIEANGHDALEGGEDVHAAIETAVIDRIGPAGGAMHTARSRNDEVAACLRYRVRDDLLALTTSALTLRENLLAVAAEHTETVMPGYTHLQPAQPTTLGHWACSYEQAVARDVERLLGAYDRTNRNPLGAAAFAGTPFPIDRDRTAELLGFDGVVENAMDAVSTRDFLLESIFASATLATTIAGIAADVVFFSSNGFVELDDDYASTSSIMPQKKNPDTMELVRATIAESIAGLTGSFTTLHGLTRAYNRDLQSLSPHCWRSMDAVVEATDVTAGAIATAEWEIHALEAAAGTGFSTATGVADALTAGGMPFRTAHQVVATAGGGGIPTVEDIANAVSERTGEPIETFVDPAEIEASLDPRISVDRRDSFGGPAHTVVESAIDRAATRVAADRASIDGLEGDLARAEESLAQAVASYV